MKALVAGLAVLAAFPASSVAVEPTPAEAVMIERFIPIAQAAWPSSPCEGREEVVLARDLSLRGVSMDGLGFNIAGAEPCRMYVRRGLAPRRLCSVLVHEWGHTVLGPGHSDDPQNPMHFDAPTWGPCAQATKNRRRKVRRGGGAA